MVRIDQLVEVGSVFLLERLYQLLFLCPVLFGPDRVDLCGHLFGHLGIAQCDNVLQSFDHTILFTRNIGKELAAFTDLLDRLLEWNRYPFVLATFAGSLEDLAQAIGIVCGL